MTADVSPAPAVVDASVVRAPGVLWRRTLDGAVILVPSGDVVSLDAIGALVWDLVAVPTTVGDVAAEVGRVFEAGGEDVTGATADLIAQLTGYSVLEVAQ